MTTFTPLLDQTREQTPASILPLDSPQASLANVGGKGASLARLVRAGLPVPDGFHVTTAAYREFVAANELQPAILAALAGIDAMQPATLEQAARTIQAYFAAGLLPDAIRTALTDAYASLPGISPSVAVRSSATAEDLPDLSFAGQQESFLNIAGVPALLAAVQACWASLWTARAIGYRAQHGIDPDALSLAVTVQLMAPAEAAGILFTANPINGRRDQTMITAAWGLGEAVVGGTVTPDTLIVDPKAHAVISRTTAEKTVMTVRTDQGTAQHPVPAHLRTAPVLADATVLALAELGATIERLYGMPMDVEWAYGDGAIAIVQARPITALPAPTVAPPTEWPLPDPKGKYMRASIVELLPDPLTPLFGTLGLAAINAETRLLMGMLLDDADIWPVPCVTINDYAYLNDDFKPGDLVRMLIKVFRRTPWMLRTAETRWHDEAHPAYVATVAPWRDRDLQASSVAELLQGVHEITAAGVHIYTTLQSGIMPASNISEGLFTIVYKHLLRGAGDPPAVTYLVGFDSTPILADKALFDLAAWCRTHRMLVDYVTTMPAAMLATDWTGATPPQAVPQAVWEEWCARVHAYLQQYGNAIYNLDFAMPLPADEPTPVFEALKLYVSGAGTSPYARQQAAVAARDAATAEINARLWGLRGAIFRRLLAWAQRYVPLRENALADIGYGWPILRRILREIGGRFSAAGVFDAPDTIFWLTEDEVRTIGVALENGEHVAPVTATVAARRAAWEAAKRVTPPPALPPKARWMGFRADKIMPARVADEGAASLKGVPCSPGRVTGTACVLRGPEDFDTMQPGDVLVAAITTPAWTPLFALAAAVVTDVGGPLSHSSIVAREYGVPAVLGTGSATQRIVSGQVITVDGTEGVVELAA